MTRRSFSSLRWVEDDPGGYKDEDWGRGGGEDGDLKHMVKDERKLIGMLGLSRLPPPRNPRIPNSKGRKGPV